MTEQFLTILYLILSSTNQWQIYFSNCLVGQLKGSMPWQVENTQIIELYVVEIGVILECNII